MKKITLLGKVRAIFDRKQKWQLVGLGIMIFIGGVQLLCMGIMGQYLSKTYMEVKRRPHYIIRETNSEDAERNK